jgi:RND family efflux transporter MFP subunit
MRLASILAVLLALASGCESRTAETGEREVSALVEVAGVDRGPVEEILETYGTVEFDPQLTREVTAPRAGEVRSVSVVAGESVRAGDPLLVLGSVPPDSPDAERARIDLEFSKRALERVRRLVAMKLATNEDVQRAEQAVAANRAALKGLGLNGSRDLVVSSPTDGIVARVPAKEGSLLSAGQLAVLVATSQAVSVRTGFEIEDMERLAPNRPVRISPIYGERDKVAHAVLPPLHGLADPQTQLVEALLEVNAPPPWLVPGERVLLRVVLKQEANALRVPLDAVLERGGGLGVFAIRGGHARWVPIEVTVSGASLLGVRADLSEGERVATVGRSSLDDGMAVRTGSPEPAG